MAGMVSYLDSQGVVDLNGPRHALLRLLDRLGAALSRIVIIGRDATYYVQEEVSLKKYSEISAYVKANAAELCPFDNWYPVFITEPHKSKTRVHIWFINPSLLQRHLSARACFLIPEELLIAQYCVSSQINAIQVMGGNAKAYLLTLASGTIRDSVLVPQNSAERDLFLQSSLASGGQSLQQLAGEEKAAVLAAELWRLPFHRLSGCWRKSTADYSVVVPELKAAGMVAVVMLVIWAVASSTYIGYRRDSLQQKLNSQQGEVKAVLLDRSRNRHLQEELTLLSRPLAGYRQVGPLLGNISALGVDNVELSSLQIIGTDLELKGEADKATEVLEVLAKQPWVKSASFITPVNRRNERDRFDIRVLVKGGSR